MLLLILFFVAAISFSFLCSILEAVLLSITPYYVGLREIEGTSFGKDLARFKGDIDRPLAAILSLNTIANTMGAVGVGAQASAVFGATRIEVAGYTFLSWEAIIAGGMTLCILVFSEVIPKTIGANNWEKLAPFAVHTLKVLLFVLAPFVWLSKFITYRLKKDKDQPVLTRADFLAMTNLGKESGAIEASEQRLINNLLKFNHILVKDIMTPRFGMVTAKDSMSVSEFHKQYSKVPFSRIPVLNEDGSSLIGYIHKDDLLAHVIDKDDELLLGEFSQTLTTVSEDLPIPDLLDYFVHEKEHMTFVVDEHGAMAGIVTMNDIIETVLELEIVDDSHDHDDWKTLARKHWRKRAKKLGILQEDND